MSKQNELEDAKKELSHLQNIKLIMEGTCSTCIMCVSSMHKYVILNLIDKDVRNVMELTSLS